MADLEIPERAVNATGARDDRDRTMVRSLLSSTAPIIVAAELRRLAKRTNDVSAQIWLRQRADELDPEGSTP